MVKEKYGFDGAPFYVEANWVGIILKGGFGTEMKWLMNILKDLNPSHPGFSCKLVQMPEAEKRDDYTSGLRLNLMEFSNDTDFSSIDDIAHYDGILREYIDGFEYSNHYFEAFDGSWRMHLPCDEQADMFEYKIWAGTREVWQKLRPFFEPLPRQEPAESGPYASAYARDFVFLADALAIPRKVVEGLGPVKFVGDVGLGWQT